MSPVLRSPDQPAPQRFLLGVFEFCASLKLAVVLILGAATVLGTATFYESLYGTPAVHFGLYGTWWFELLNALLAVNIFSAAAIRYPWKRHQTGFVITHIGLLVLLFGCLLSRSRGVDAQLLVFEGATNHEAWEHEQFFDLQIVDDEHGSETSGGVVEGVTIPFRGGPFNWERLGDMPWFPWALARRDRGVIYDRQGIRLEVLDYYSNSQEVSAPSVKLSLSTPPRQMPGPDGKQRDLPESWQQFQMDVRPHVIGALRRRGLGFAPRSEQGGGEVAFWMAGSEGQTEAFLNSAPDEPLGEKGQVVLWVEGKRVSFDVAEKLDAGSFTLGETGYTVEKLRYLPTARPRLDEQEELQLSDVPGVERPQNPAVELSIRGKGDADDFRIVLLADMPEMNRHNLERGLYGEYWFDHKPKTTEERMAGGGRSRIDLLQGTDQKLYYRYWKAPRVELAAPLPSSGEAVPAFSMPIAQLKMAVDNFVPAEKAGPAIVPLPFNKEQTPVDSQRAAKVRLTVDDTSEEFWIIDPPIALVEGLKPSPLKRRVVAGDGRTVALSLELVRIDIGFNVKLRNFERKLDPGTSQPSHYSSWVDLLPRRGGSAYARNLWITMNAPINFKDPGTGRTYRLYQENFGPQQERWGPGHPIYEAHVPDHVEKPDLSYSILTVNYDPGRGLKYVGCVLVLLGIATMFYMRAYFFKPRRGAAAGPRGPDRTKKERHALAEEVV